ncbi:MAG: Trm112 family protein [Planctomycetota bacterium]|nr:Trm112 family protein [Planctomycetota bacterium]
MTKSEPPVAPAGLDRRAGLDPRVVAILRCPRTGQALREERSGERHELVTVDGTLRYPVVNGMPVLSGVADQSASPPAGPPGPDAVSSPG